MSVLAMRRRFLLDLAYPSADPVLADLLGLPPASVDVIDPERADAIARVQRLVADPRVAACLGGAADDMAALLDGLDHEDRRVWLVSYALAVTNLLESLGVVEISQ